MAGALSAILHHEDKGHTWVLLRNLWDEVWLLQDRGTISSALDCCRLSSHPPPTFQLGSMQAHPVLAFHLTHHTKSKLCVDLPC